MVCVLLINLISVSIICVSQKGNCPFEFNQQMYGFYNKFLKIKYIANLCKVKVHISKLSIQCNTGSCCVHVTSGVNIYWLKFEKGVRFS